MARGAWVATVIPDAPAMLAGLRRRESDRRAAALARTAAVRAIGHRALMPRLSVSHSGGAGAAIVAPPPCRVGVDVMPLGRVGTRHMHAILTREEVLLLRQIDSALAATVAWTIKEATLKASGLAGLLAPTGVRIGACAADGHAAVDVAGQPDAWHVAGWGVDRGFVYAWVVGGDY